MMKRNMVITISGAHGTGKSTLARRLAKRFNLRYVSAGGIFRELAKKHNMSVEEFGRYCEQNYEVDRQIDKLIQDEAKKGNVILDGQLSWYFAKNYAHLKILLKAPLEVRIKRIALRDGIDYDSALKATIAREESEQKRYKEIYNISEIPCCIFDVVLDTSKYGLQSIENILATIVEELDASSTEG